MQVNSKEWLLQARSNRASSQGSPMALGMMGDDLDWTEERGMACAMSPPDFADGREQKPPEMPSRPDSGSMSPQ